MSAGGALATAHVSFLVILSLFIFLSQLWRAPRLCATCGVLLSQSTQPCCILLARSLAPAALCPPVPLSLVWCGESLRV